MPVVRRADEEVVRRVDPDRHLAEGRGVPVDELLEVEPRLLGDARDVRAVLVRAGQEERLLAALALVAHQDVRSDRRVRVADVRRRIDVVDRRRHVEAHRRPSYGRGSGGRSAVSSRRRGELRGGSTQGQRPGRLGPSTTRGRTRTHPMETRKRNRGGRDDDRHHSPSRRARPDRHPDRDSQAVRAHRAGRARDPVKDQTILLSRPRSACVFCGSTRSVVEHRGRGVCRACVKELAAARARTLP